jgi:hypothetical protein
MVTMWLFTANRMKSALVLAASERAGYLPLAWHRQERARIQWHGHTESYFFSGGITTGRVQRSPSEWKG